VKALTNWIQTYTSGSRKLSEPFTAHLCEFECVVAFDQWMGAQRIRSALGSSHNWLCAVVVRSVGCVRSLAHLPYLQSLLAPGVGWTQRPLSLFLSLSLSLSSTQFWQVAHVNAAYAMTLLGGFGDVITPPRTSHIRFSTNSHWVSAAFPLLDPIHRDRFHDWKHPPDSTIITPNRQWDKREILVSHMSRNGLESS
jgi:hypothetical protein